MNIIFYTLVEQREFTNMQTANPHITLHDGNGTIMSYKNAAEAFNVYCSSIYNKDNSIV